MKHILQVILVALAMVGGMQILENGIDREIVKDLFVGLFTAVVLVFVFHKLTSKKKSIEE